MATPDLTSGQVMDRAAALLNDPSKTIFTYVAQLPYLNMALQELQEIFELNEVPVTADVTAEIAVDANVSRIGFDTTPSLPSDFIEPSMLWERPRNINPYVPMTDLKILPLYMEGIQIPQLIYYVWEKQSLNFLPANADNDIKINYIRNLFTTFESTDGDDEVGVINAASFLEFETASLCARYIGQDVTRADSLMASAGLALDRALGIGAKGRQATVTRRRPFRAGYKRRSYM